jgi:hypothetical protein
MRPARTYIAVTCGRRNLRKFDVEMLEWTPYCTRSCLPNAAALRDRGGKKAGLSPRIPCAKGREETLLF